MNLGTGLYQLLTSPSYLFALVCLGIMAWKAPYVGTAGFAAFFGVIPGILAYAEHKEQLAQINQPTIPPKGMP